MTRVPPMTEAQFQRRILDYCQMRGLLVFHDQDSRRNQPGFPDLVIASPRHILFRELKTDTGTIRPEQVKWLNTMREAGADAGVWRPKDWTEHVLPQLAALTLNPSVRGR